MEATKRTTCVMMTMMVMTVMMTQALLTSSSANLINSCRTQCRAEQELKAACSEERDCDSRLPDLSAFVECLEPCASLGNNCFQRCAFKTDRISAICSRHCHIGGAVSQPISIPGEVGSSGVAGAEGNEAGSLCYKTCYDSLLNAAMNRVYRKRP